MSGLCSHAPDLGGLAGDPGSAVHRRDPRAKLVGLVAVTVAAVSAPLGAWPVYAACALVLAAVAAVARVPAHAIWRRARLVLPPVLLVAALLPFVRTGGSAYALGPASVSEEGLRVLGEVAAKATIGTVSAVLLAATTSFPALLRALDALRAPRTLTLIAGVMYRYLPVVAAEAQRMRIALAARAYRPRHALQAGELGRATTALFLRTHARGERVHLAMLARGFAGTMPALAPLAFRRADAAFAAAIVALLLGVRIAA